MDTYEHITKYENILNEHSEKIEEIRKNIEWLHEHQAEYGELMDYYYSDRRNRDLEDDGKGLIPKDLRRGVLSEDAIWNFASEREQLGIRMMEVALELIKNR